MTRNIEVRLIGHSSADGQLLADDAVALITAFKEVTYRLTRSVADRSGAGRADAALEKIATVRVGLRTGSTRVVFTVGDDAALIDPLAEEVNDAFWSIVTGISTNERPGNLSDNVADAVDDLIVALSKAAPEVEVSASGHETRSLTMNAVSRAPWRRAPAQAVEPAVLHGVLEMVDLRTARFRLRDAAGNGIELINVLDATRAANLVGRHVRVRGALVVGGDTQRHRLLGAHVLEAESIEERLGIPTMPSLDELLIRAADLPVAPALELTDEEIDDLLAAVHGG